MQTLETFAANKWSSTKRFGLEGCEALIAGLKTMLDTASRLGVDHVVFGMPHRGRLNVLSNVMRKPLVRCHCVPPPTLFLLRRVFAAPSSCFTVLPLFGSVGM